MSAGIRAMPQAARATHASHRAVLHRLGLSVGIAIALSGCRLGPHQNPATPEKEADAFCYSQARDDAARPAVREALSDGILTDAECSDVIMPLVEASNRDFRARIRREANEAVRAASAMSAGTAETRSGSGRQPASAVGDVGNADGIETP
jgi:hypothetical protein